MKNLIILGISGKKQSGKDTVAGMIKDFILECETYRKPQVKKFAQGLKEAAAEILDCESYEFESEESKKGPAAPWLPEITKREFLQKLGTNVAHAIDPSIWIKREFYNLTEQDRFFDGDPQKRLVIFTDVRFPLEAGKILLKGGHLLRVHDPTPREEDTAPSETALDNYSFPFVLTNYKNSLEELREQVLEYLIHSKILERRGILNSAIFTPGK